MRHYARKARLIPGKLEEYKRRHDEIWPKLTGVLDSAGIHNYAIWNAGEDLFGYYECEHGVEYAARVQRESEVVARWDEYKKEVMVMEPDPETGAQPKLTQVFYHR